MGLETNLSWELCSKCFTYVFCIKNHFVFMQNISDDSPNDWYIKITTYKSLFIFSVLDIIEKANLLSIRQRASPLTLHSQHYHQRVKTPQCLLYQMYIYRKITMESPLPWAVLREEIPKSLLLRFIYSLSARRTAFGGNQTYYGKSL